VILEGNALMANVFHFTGLEEYVKDCICLGEIKSFDREELERLLSGKGVRPEEFYKRINDVDPFVILNCRLASTYSAQERESVLKDSVEVDPETGERKLKNAPFILNYFGQERANLLNQLEWFGMNCRYGLADEELLYQSLHQTYLNIVWVLYPFISRSNTCNEDKHYTNVAWLFDKWYGRLCGIKEKAEKKKKKYQRKMDSVKPEVFSGRGL
jgi:hypothetical protein